MFHYCSERKLNLTLKLKVVMLSEKILTFVALSFCCKFCQLHFCL